MLSARLPVLIEAGGGFGKSVLLEQVRNAGGGLGLRLPRQHPVAVEELQALVLDTAGVGTVGDLLRASAEPGLLVVDNTESLTEDAAAWLADLAQDGMPSMRVVATGRLLPIPLAAMEFRGTAERFNTQDLRLTTEESAALAQIEIGDVDGERLSPTLHDLSGGWVALLLVMLRRLARADDRMAAAAELVRHPGLIRQLVDHYAGDLEPTDRYLLTQLAHFPMVSERLVDGLGAQGLLRRLIHAGIPFAVGADGWWRLCATLQEHLTALAPLDQEIARRAAPLLVAEGVELAAAGLLADSGEPEQAVRLIAQLPTRRINLLDPMEFIRLMARVGPAAEAAPQVLLHLARSHRNVGQLAEEREVIRRALRVVREHSPDDEDLAVEVEGEWLIQRAALGYTDVLEQIEQLLEGTAKGTRAQASLLEALGVALSDMPDEASLRRAENAMRQAAITWGELGEPSRVASVQRSLAVRVMAGLGKTDEAAVLLRRLGAASETPYDRMLCLIFEARLLALSGEAERTAAILDEALPLAELLEIDWVIGHAAWTRMIVAANEHDRATVLEQLALAESHLGQLINDGGGLLFLCEAAEACAVVGAESRSSRLVEAARERRSEDPLALAFTEALIDARGGDPEAADDLQKMLSNHEVAPGLRWKAELLSGYAQHSAGDIDEANQSLLAALDRAASLGHPDLPDRRERRVVGILRSAISTTQPDDNDDPDAPRNYQVQVLGGFEVRSGSEVLDGTGRAAQLVKHLVLAGGSASVDNVVETLWPGEMPGVGQRRLKNVLSRARAAYGTLISRRGRHLRLVEACVDLIRFEELARTVAATPDSERVARAREALDIVVGPVLPEDLYDDQIAQRREAVRRRVLGLLDVVMAADLDGEDLDDALARLESAMDLDPYDQERPLRVARALVERGRALEAKTLATRVIASADELGVPAAVEWHELALTSGGSVSPR